MTPVKQYVATPCCRRCAVAAAQSAQEIRAANVGSTVNGPGQRTLSASDQGRQELRWTSARRHRVVLLSRHGFDGLLRLSVPCSTLCPSPPVQDRASMDLCSGGGTSLSLCRSAPRDNCAVCDAETSRRVAGATLCLCLTKSENIGTYVPCSRKEKMEWSRDVRGGFFFVRCKRCPKHRSENPPWVTWATFDHVSVGF